MLSVDDFRKKYPGSSEEQVALYGAAVEAERANPPKPEPDVPMPMVTVPAPLARASNLFVGERSASAPTLLPQAPTPDLTSDIRRIVLGRRLTPRERAAAERPDMSGDDLLALLAGVPNAREWEALEGD